MLSTCCFVADCGLEGGMQQVGHTSDARFQSIGSHATGSSSARFERHTPQAVILHRVVSLMPACCSCSITQSVLHLPLTRAGLPVTWLLSSAVSRALGCGGFTLPLQPLFAAPSSAVPALQAVLLPGEPKIIRGLLWPTCALH